MAISNATRLSDFGSGIGTQGAIIQVDNANQRVGIGTTNPQFTLDVKGTLNATTLGLTNINVTGIASIGAGVTVYGAGIVSATAYNIGISSAGTSITSNIKTLNFVGTGNTFKVSGNTVDVSISGGGGGASKVYSDTIFAYQNIVQSDITIESPYLTATFYCAEDITVDIEDDVTVTVDDGAVLQIITI